MAAQLNRQSETAVHAGLKRLAMIWAQARGYSACALEVHLPHLSFPRNPATTPLESLPVAIRTGAETRLADANANVAYELLISTNK